MTLPSRFVIAVALALLARDAAAQVRRAVVVGINDYGSAKLAQPPPARTWSNLEGAVADAQAMRELLLQRYGFEERNVVSLFDAQATGEAIVAAAEKLVAGSKAGDVAVFYFAGHGSQVRNSRTKEPDQRDETLVPWDSRSGAPDITDKRLGAVFERAGRRGVLLTIVLDSCHSGSATRGASTMRLRQIAPDLAHDSADPSDPHPELAGVLTVSAAQDYQPAAEAADEKGRARGAFTSSLVRVLASSPTWASADAVFQATREDMRARGYYQEPVLEGTAARRKAPILGQKVRGASGRPIAAVVDVDREKRTIKLRAGIATGVGPGTIYARSAGGAGPGAALRLRVTEVEGLTTSLAVPVSADATLQGVEPGTIFEQEKLAPPSEAALAVQVTPRPPPFAALQATARELAALRTVERIAWVDDPGALVPTHLVTFEGAGWVLVAPDGGRTALGVAPRAAEVAAALARTPLAADREAPCDGAACLFVRVPPPRELVEALAVGRERSDAVQRVERDADAEYALAGRVAPGGAGIEYAWLRLAVPARRCAGLSGPAADAAGADACRAANGALRTMNAPAPATLPPRTDWFSPGSAPAAIDARALADRLDRSVTRIARVAALLKLQPPPGDDAFPYRVVLRRDGSGEQVASGVLHEGVYRLALAAQEGAPLDAVVPRRVYVLAVQSDGAIRVLFPRAGVENVFPTYGAEPRAAYPLSGPAIRVGKPYGVDTLVLIASAEVIPGLDALEQEEVVRTRGTSSALSDLLVGHASRTRGFAAEATSDWSIQRAQFETRP